MPTGQENEKIMNETLKAKIDEALALAKQDADEMEATLKSRIELREACVAIWTYESRNPAMNANGGDYDYFTKFKPVDGGVLVIPDWSADWDPEEYLGEPELVESESVTLDVLFAHVQGCAQELSAASA